MFKALQPLILASESPRRKRLLQALGIDFLVEPSNIDESIETNQPEEPSGISKRWAELKAQSISTLYPDSWVLAADTIVVLDGQIFGKPSDREDAVRMLRTLSGRIHDVITGMCLVRPGKILQRSCSVVTKVRFKELSDSEIEAYVETGKPMDKAGAYGIQGIGAFLVKSVEGSYTNVVGLPLCETIEWLLAENIIVPE